MQHRAAGAVVMVVAVLAAFPGVAAGGSSPVITASCAVAGVTRADWQHAKVTKVTVEWNAPAGSGVTFDSLVLSGLAPHPPRGLVSTATPSVGGIAPESATLSFEQKNGAVTKVTTSCN